MWKRIEFIWSLIHALIVHINVYVGIWNWRHHYMQSGIKHHQCRTARSREKGSTNSRARASSRSEHNLHPRADALNTLNTHTAARNIRRGKIFKLKNVMEISWTLIWNENRSVITASLHNSCLYLSISYKLKSYISQSHIHDFLHVQSSTHALIHI